MNKRVVIFFRPEGFYPVEYDAHENWARQAELNPGTLKIEDALSGEVLWERTLN